MEPANRQPPSPARNLGILNNDGQKNTQEFNPSPTNFFQAKEEKPASDGSYFSLSELANSLLSGGNKPDQKRMFHKRLEQFMEKAYNGDICGSDICAAIRLLPELAESGKLTKGGETAIKGSIAELEMLYESFLLAEEKDNQAEQKPNSNHPPAEKKDDGRSFANRSTGTPPWGRGRMIECNESEGSDENNSNKPDSLKVEKSNNNLNDKQEIINLILRIEKTIETVNRFSRNRVPDLAEEYRSELTNRLSVLADRLTFLEGMCYPILQQLGHCVSTLINPTIRDGRPQESLDTTLKNNGLNVMLDKLRGNLSIWLLFEQAQGIINLIKNLTARDTIVGSNEIDEIRYLAHILNELAVLIQGSDHVREASITELIALNNWLENATRNASTNPIEVAALIKKLQTLENIVKQLYNAI